MDRQGMVGLRRQSSYGMADERRHGRVFALDEYAMTTPLQSAARDVLPLLYKDVGGFLVCRGCWRAYMDRTTIEHAPDCRVARLERETEKG